MQRVYVRGNKIVKRKPSTSLFSPPIRQYTFAPYLPSFALHDITRRYENEKRKILFDLINLKIIHVMGLFFASLFPTWRDFVCVLCALTH